MEPTRSEWLPPPIDAEQFAERLLHLLATATANGTPVAVADLIQQVSEVLAAFDGGDAAASAGREGTGWEVAGWEGAGWEGAGWEVERAGL